MERENYTEEIKVRLTLSQLTALEKVSADENSKPATEARRAIHDMLMAEDAEYREQHAERVAASRSKRTRILTQRANSTPPDAQKGR